MCVAALQGVQLHTCTSGQGDWQPIKSSLAVTFTHLSLVKVTVALLPPVSRLPSSIYTAATIHLWILYEIGVDVTLLSLPQMSAKHLSGCVYLSKAT